MRITRAFQITGRGLAVTVEETTDLPVRRKLSAVVTRPDGTSVRAEAYKRWLLRRAPDPVEEEAFLLLGLTRDDVVVGSLIALSLA